jgi:hypothetical protein
MSDLKVDFATLEQAHSTAEALRREFDGLPHRYDQYAGSYGRDDIRGAMHSFATNWDYHRKILSEKIGEVGEKVESCLEAFRKADAKLASELEKATHESHGSSERPGGPR